MKTDFKKATEKTSHILGTIALTSIAAIAGFGLLFICNNVDLNDPLLSQKSLPTYGQLGTATLYTFLGTGISAIVLNMYSKVQISETNESKDKAKEATLDRRQFDSNPYAPPRNI